MGFQLAEQLLLRKPRSASGRHDRQGRGDVRQLGGEPAQPLQPAAPCPLGLESTDEMGSVNFRAVPVNESDVQRFKDAVRDQFVDEVRVAAENDSTNAAAVEVARGRPG